MVSNDTFKFSISINRNHFYAEDKDILLKGANLEDTLIFILTFDDERDVIIYL